MTTNARPERVGTGAVESVPGRHAHDSAFQGQDAPLALFPESLDVQLVRRRAAALRCPPLACGRRDPLERPERRDPLSSPRRLHVEKGPRNTAWLHGGRLKQLCEHANVPHLYDHNLKTWRISVRRIDDLIVFAEHIEGRFVTVEEVDR